MAERIGKFEVRRLLGKGAQSAVYLAYDAHLDREVAIKKLKLTDRDPLHREALINEARTVGKLRHANIVPIFDAGEQDGEPYLVFEYVEGSTLSQLIRKEGTLPAERAVPLMIGVLEAIDAAHRSGVIHRDLKPSNILVNSEGVARVMDFGIASRVDGGAGAVELQGTPAYMAPEYIAKRIINAQTDVFAAGLILYEMVFGRRAVDADNPFQAMHRIANEDIKPPPGNKSVDDKLVDLIAKATARDPQLRFENAGQMRDALTLYLNPLSEAEDAEGKKQSTIDFLLRRMRHKSDFPAMSQAISAINRLAASEKGNIHSLSNSILKDFALTNKILRIANSALYRQFGAGTISTVSRAIVVLGFDAVRSIALSLMLFEHIQHKQHQDLLREEFLRANFAGVLGKQFATSFGLHRTEESFICAMFHNLGRLLTHYYFPEEAEAIAKIVTTEKCSEDQAATKVLGISFQELGIGIAKSWGFPEELVGSMKRLPPGNVPTTHSLEDTLRCLSTFSNEVCTVFQNAPASSRQSEVRVLQKRYGKNLSLTDKELGEILKQSTDEMTELARVIGFNLKASKLGRQILPAVETAAAPASSTAANPPTLPGGAEKLQTAVEAAQESEGSANGGTIDAPPTVDAQSVLAAGIQDISQALVEIDSLGDLLRIIIETMYRAMGFKRVLLCMRDGRTGQMSARFGFGIGADEAATYFRFTLGGRNDIFNIILSNDKDVLISDASDPKLTRFIPEWFKLRFPVQTFIVFPLRIKGSPVAMIYADKDYANSIVVTDKELSLLRTLCNQAILAIKQSAGGR